MSAREQMEKVAAFKKAAAEDAPAVKKLTLGAKKIETPISRAMAKKNAPAKAKKVKVVTKRADSPSSVAKALLLERKHTDEDLINLISEKCPEYKKWDTVHQMYIIRTQRWAINLKETEKVKTLYRLPDGKIVPRGSSSKRSNKAKGEEAKAVLAKLTKSLPAGKAKSSK
jgi:hypothetical protein